MHEHDIIILSRVIIPSIIFDHKSACVYYRKTTTTTTTTTTTGLVKEINNYYCWKVFLGRRFIKIVQNFILDIDGMTHAQF